MLYPSKMVRECVVQFRANGAFQKQQACDVLLLLL